MIDDFLDHELSCFRLVLIVLEYDKDLMMKRKKDYSEIDIAIKVIKELMEFWGKLSAAFEKRGCLDNKLENDELENNELYKKFTEGKQNG
jgi:hypothetical protein